MSVGDTREVRVHVLPSEHWVDDDAYATIVDVAASAEEDVRSLLATLAEDLYLLVHQTNVVIPETGDGVVRRWEPVDGTWMQWKFDHPDGRRNIAHKVGTWIAERAISNSNLSAADLVWESPARVLELAGIAT